MEVSVLKYNGEDTGKKVSLSDEIFSVSPNDHAIYLDVKRFLANQRQGTHKAKERAEIVGSTKKIKRQKGTGTARSGDIKSPIFRGGGRVFGPRPRSYDQKINRKVKLLARKSALSYKARENGITVVEDFDFEKPKTKEYQQMLKNLSVQNTKTLLVLPANSENIYLSGRNIPKTKIISAHNLSTYDVVDADNLIISEGSVEIIEGILNKQATAQ